MTPSQNTRIAVAAAVVALAAAGAAAAANKLHHGHAHAAPLAAGSFVSSSTATGHRFGGRDRGGPEGPLAAAATYLGISRSDLRTQLQAGKTLAQIANATSGKSESGLVDALYADAKTHIDADVSAGRLAQAQADQILSNLKADITRHVESTGPPPDGHGPHGPGDDLAAAASYLGMTQSALQTQLQAGKTLAQIADATSGKSTAGLIAALVAAEKTEIEAGVTAGRLTRAQADDLEGHLTDRFTKLVNGQLPPHGDGRFGPPPANGTHI